ncbi:MAG: putative toxin-antitoxin system toxin component, PIN family [Spirosomaceae bacterium]|jgi:putative PIN family toxin of toxin-antitoxin system|nr:putative toxin-antitoxin system toxin component, PIN family [Spirosomataceae bacterium]
MKVVIDTNCLLVSISRKSKYNWLFQALIDKKFELCLTTEILNEYEEIIDKYFSKETVEPVYEILTTASNIHKIEVSFKLQLIYHDPDDDKFVDCAFAGNANYIVTNDTHYDILKDIDFPRFNVITIQKFKEILENA